ncbi:MAG: hypothetical protein SWX82_29990 [Cyanobacteriota bacterium]|nr:hypothetical protein [Cyanobacteriota bacterium]
MKKESGDSYTGDRINCLWIVNDLPLRVYKPQAIVDTAGEVWGFRHHKASVRWSQLIGVLAKKLSTPPLPYSLTSSLFRSPTLPLPHSPTPPLPRSPTPPLHYSPVP